MATILAATKISSASGFIPQRPAFPQPRVRKCIVRAQAADNMDGGSEDEDTLLGRELDQLKNKLDPQNNAKIAQHLNLMWSASQRKSPERCECCSGSGERECHWCHGTGAMTLGDTLYCSDGGCRPCLICKGQGACKCEACRGTGKRAPWISQNNCRN